MDGFKDGIRRFVRLVLSGAWAWLALQLFALTGVELTPEDAAHLDMAIMVIATAIANAIIALLSLWFKKMGWDKWINPERLLGSGRSPVYVNPADTVAYRTMITRRDEVAQAQSF